MLTDRKRCEFTNVSKYSRKKPSRVLQNPINIPAGLSQYFVKGTQPKKHTKKAPFRTEQWRNDPILNWWFWAVFLPSKLSLEQFEMVQKVKMCYFSHDPPLQLLCRNDNSLASIQDLILFKAKGHQNGEFSAQAHYHVGSLMKILSSLSPLKGSLAILSVFLHRLFIHSLRTLTGPVSPFKGLLTMWWINLSLSILNLLSVVIASGSHIYGNFSPLRID